MGIMDFVQPDAADDIFAEMGISRAAPVAIPEPIVHKKSVEKPRVVEAPKPKPVIEVVQAPIAAPTLAKEPSKVQESKASPSKAQPSNLT